MAKTLKMFPLLVLLSIAMFSFGEVDVASANTWIPSFSVNDDGINIDDAEADAMGTVGTVGKKVINVLYVIALICVLGGFALAGIKLVTSGSNPSKREAATTYIFVLIGAGVLIGSATFIVTFAINLL